MKLTDLNIKDFAAQLASSAPAPGGGSAAALSGLMGVSLLEMVANLTVGRKKYAEHEELMQSIITEAKNHHQALLNAIDLDAKAYDQVSAAYKLPKETDEDKAARSAAIQKTLKAATLSPFAILAHCEQSLELAQKAVGKANTNAASDLGVCAMALKTGAQGAWMNILINLMDIKDEDFVNDIKQKSQAALAKTDAICDEITKYVMAEIS
ncbi:MAG: cyclodeaminase/cyclohydrolase family protein [Defluviitaleaceae bacterium]|nr:cyclodeaminase/cyclohydrolase family protein [Defluviitaleaceae bacterium]